jgi:hypothetical protein
MQIQENPRITFYAVTERMILRADTSRFCQEERFGFERADANHRRIDAMERTGWEGRKFKWPVGARRSHMGRYVYLVFSPGPAAQHSSELELHSTPDQFSEGFCTESMTIT